MISIRDLEESDIQSILDYWYHSPEGYIDSIGVDRAKMVTEAEMKKFLLEKIAFNKKLPISKMNALIILQDGVPIGNHSLNPVDEGDSGLFHAHIWSEQHRKAGVGLQSYPLACMIYFERFNLETIIFKTPVQNVGAIRVKEKLGIVSSGEEIMSFNIMKNNTRVKSFELSREEANRLWAKA